MEKGEGVEEEAGGREQGSRSDGDASKEKKRAVKEEKAVRTGHRLKP